MTYTRRKGFETPVSNPTGWRNSRAWKAIEENIRAAVAEDPSIPEQFTSRVDSNPRVGPISKRAETGEFAAKAIEERYGPETLALAKAVTGGAR